MAYNTVKSERSRDGAMTLVCAALLTAAAGCYLPLAGLGLILLPAVLLALLAANLLPLLFLDGRHGGKLRVLRHGAVCLRAFMWSAGIMTAYHIALLFALLPLRWTALLWSVLVCAAAEATVLWNGIACVYCTSTQLGVKKRVAGALCGLIPVANLFVLGDIVRTVNAEGRFEAEKAELDKTRAAKRICRTKYPLLLVHGVFFRDYKLLNYWGRIPAELEKNGAQVFYGGHQSASSVKDSGGELAERIKDIVASTGCGKVNIIAHSKGGLDCRWAISRCGAAPLVASLTTINTPHRGCGFADYLLEKVPQKTQRGIENAYNAAMLKLGDSAPDFMAAVRDLTAARCKAFNAVTPDASGVRYFSVGSVLRRASHGRFPLNYTFRLVKYFDGPNDGLVSTGSFPWGERFELLEAQGRRGVSHGDVIDLNRENIPGFDVREFYVDLTAGLKSEGL